MRGNSSLKLDSIYISWSTKPLRYRTAGDYSISNSGAGGTASLRVDVISLPDWRMSMLVAIHELIEATIVLSDGKPSFAEIDAFDLAHPELDDPGADPRAPYRDAHMFASKVEEDLAKRLGIDWKEYDDAIETTLDRIHPKT